MHAFGESSTVCGFDLERLPELGAEMMLSGCPVELLDGDVNHIPLDWISAVLEKLIHKVGDQRVLVISVLGLQSSGKSTLLNVMFGLEFAVGVGRCTKGAFMQLVPVEKQLKDQLQFDFILLLDTEGLRSVEADKSNVADTAAKDKTQEGRRQLISKLDEISKVVAEAEDREVSGFSDIIQFDAETQVFYFKNYFDGDPPMAHPKSSYSQNAQELKHKLLSISEWQPKCKLSLLSELSERIHNLWNALMKENFVFHFRNSLHIMVYTKLEEQYGKWSWKMRKHALETQNTLHYMITSTESYKTQVGQFKRDFETIYQDLKGDVDSSEHAHELDQYVTAWVGNSSGHHQENPEPARREGNNAI
ncbi:hypothetical protein SRHO_G00027670 [Serrasalmus rhombeus]